MGDGCEGVAPACLHEVREETLLLLVQQRGRLCRGPGGQDMTAGTSMNTHGGAGAGSHVVAVLHAADVAHPRLARHAAHAVRGGRRGVHCAAPPQGPPGGSAGQRWTWGGEAASSGGPPSRGGALTQGHIAAGLCCRTKVLIVRLQPSAKNSEHSQLWVRKEGHSCPGHSAVLATTPGNQEPHPLTNRIFDALCRRVVHALQAHYSVQLSGWRAARARAAACLRSAAKSEVQMLSTSSCRTGTAGASSASNLSAMAREKAECVWCGVVW